MGQHSNHLPTQTSATNIIFKVSNAQQVQDQIHSYFYFFTAGLLRAVHVLIGSMNLQYGNVLCSMASPLTKGLLSEPTLSYPHCCRVSICQLHIPGNAASHLEELDRFSTCLCLSRYHGFASFFSSPSAHPDTHERLLLLQWVNSPPPPPQKGGRPRQRPAFHSTLLTCLHLQMP